MKIKIIFLFAVLLFSTSKIFSQTSKVDSLLKEGNKSIVAMNEEKALTQFLEALKTDALNYEANWQVSLLYSKIGNRKISIADKKQYFVQAKQYAVKSLKINPTDAESNFVMSVAMGRMALISAAKEKVDAANDIKKYADLALKYNPNHPAAWHVLGKWNYEVVNLSWAEKQAANVLMGGIDGTATIADAIADYQKAIALKPSYILYYLDLAKAYDNKGDKANAVITINKLLTFPISTEDDAAYITEAKTLLAKDKQ